MNEPVFPKEFVKNHCPRVVNARRRGDESPEDFAECSFNSAGLGLLCEICNLHLTRPYCNELKAAMKAYINPKLREILDDPAKAEEYAKKLGRGQNEEVTGIEHFYAERKKINMAEDTPSLPTSSEIIKGLSYLETEAALSPSERGVSVCAEHDVFYAMIQDDGIDKQKLDMIVKNMEALGWNQNDLNGELSFQIFV
jgi:hypothetical protein